MPEFPNEETAVVSPIELGDKAEDAAANLVKRHMAQFGAWEAWRRPMESLWAEIYQLYVGVGKGTKVPTRAKVMIPVVFQIIETALPKLTSIIFGMAEWFSVACPSGVMGDKQVTGIQRLIAGQLQKARFFRKFIDFGKQLMLYGTSYFLVYWKVRREWVVTRKAVQRPKTLLGIPLPFSTTEYERSLEYKVVERRPEIEVLPIENVFPDPDCADQEDARGWYVVKYTTLEDLKAQSKGKYPIYANIDKLEEMGGGQADKQQFTTQKESIRGVSPATPDSSKTKQVELITYWGREDLDGDGIPEEVQVVIANRSVLLKAARNPFDHQMRPIVACQMFPVPHEPYGMGLVEPVIPMIHELVTIRNQHLDMNNLILNRMWKVSTLADVEMDTLVSRPNGVILTSEMDGVEPLIQPEIPYSPREMSAVIQADIENATAPKSIQGSPDNSTLGRTARGAQLIVGQALEKFGMASKVVEETIRRVLDICHRLDRQFLETPEVIAEMYPDIEADVNPEVLGYPVDFLLLGVGETVTKEAAMNQITGFLSMFKDVPGIDLLGVARAYWDRMGLNVRSEDVISQMSPAMMSAVTSLNRGGTGNPAADAVAAQAQTNGLGGGAEIPVPEAQ